jgi:hypothetical protein
LEGEPEHVHLAKVGASNSVPVGLSILDRWDGEVLGLSADGPSGLGDPDFLVANSALHLLERVLEQAGTSVDRVGHGVLEVRIGVHAGPVNSPSDSRVGGVCPCGPRIDVADGDLAQGGGGKSLSDLLDVADEVVWVCAGARLGVDARRGDAVEILATNGDTDDQVGELRSPLLDGRLESSELSLNLAVTSGGPDTEEEGGILRNGSWDGGDGFVGRATTLLEVCQSERPVGS